MSADNNERLVRVETKLEHIDGTMQQLSHKIAEHERTATKTFAEIRETAIRQQMVSENLIEAVQKQNESHVAQDAALAGRVTAVEDKMSKMMRLVFGVTLAGGAIWAILGKLILVKLGIG